MEAMITWATANTGLITLASAAASAVGAISSGNHEAAAQESAAQAAEYNAQVNRNRADSAMQVANANEEAQRRHARSVAGQTRAGLIQAGTGTDGSAADVLQQSSSNAELDALNIRYEGVLQAQGLTSQAGIDDWQAQQNRRNASSARTAGWMNAGTAALSRAGSYAIGKANLDITRGIGLSQNPAPVTTANVRVL